MPLWVFLSSLVLALLVGWPVWKLLSRSGVVDQPNVRSSHSTPTVRGGGIGIVCVLLAGGIVLGLAAQDFSLWITLGATLFLAVVSFVDDIRSVSPGVRFTCQAMCALATLAAMGFPQITLTLQHGGGWVIPMWLSSAVLFFWICGYTNAFNFMDGINGIAGGQALITSGATVWIAILAGAPANEVSLLFICIIAGAAAGFLPYNFPKARMFMGDVGSAPLGFLLSAVAVWVAAKFGWWLLIPLLLLHTNYILDTAITLLRRILQGQRWYAPHREHFYQRLIRAGKGHTFVTLCEMGIQLGVVALAITYLNSTAFARAGLVLLVLVLWLAFFGWCELVFVRSSKVVSPLAGSVVPPRTN